jgi:MFS family permease
MLGSLALSGLRDAPAESSGEPVGRVVWNVVIDLWDVLKTRSGILCCALCFLPIGTGAASSVLAQAEVAARWGAGESQVELVNGLLSGFISALGCLAGGQLCGRFPSRGVYAAVGALMASVTAIMALCPSVPMVFVVFGLLYSFVTGLAYAAFTGFVLEAIGAGAAATKYNIFAALSNTPITYMGLVLAWAVVHWGPNGMLMLESVAGIAGLGLLGVLVMVLRALPAKPAAEAETAPLMPQGGP